MTKVVNIRHESCDVYIGRSNSKMGLVGSIWHNPYRMPEDGTRDEVIAKFEDLMRIRLSVASDYWLPRLLALRGHILGCWCKPNACHGDVLLKLIKEYDND